MFSSQKIIEGEELLDVVNIFMASIAVMVSRVYTYLQTHQVVYVKFVCQSYLHKVVLKRKKCKLLVLTPELLYQNSGGGAQPSVCDSDACSLLRTVSPCLLMVRNAEPQAPTQASCMKIPRPLGCIGELEKHCSRLSPLIFSN